MIAKEGNLTRAAETLNTSQPAVSMQLKALEKELGVILFNRSNKGMELTAFGKELIPLAEATLGSVQNIHVTAESFKGMLEGSVKIGISLDPDEIKLSDLLIGLSGSYPNLRIEVRPGVSGAIQREIGNERLDCGFILNNQAGMDLFSIPLFTLPLSIVAPAGWTDKIEGKSWEEILSLPWILPTPSCSYRQVIIDMCKDRGFPDKVFVEAGQESIFRKLVENGMGLSLIRKSRAIPLVEAKKIVEWKGYEPYTQAHFCCLKERMKEPKMNAVIEMIKTLWKIE